jgi:hypothetical protein
MEANVFKNMPTVLPHMGFKTETEPDGMKMFSEVNEKGNVMYVG